MAKSSRATTTKRNRTALRTKVFGPADLARTKRLSEKLAAIASTPKKPTEESSEQAATKKYLGVMKLMRSSTEPAESKDDGEDSIAAGAMDVDTPATTTSRKEEKRRKEAKAARIEKKQRRKTHNMIGFSKKSTTKSRK